MSTTMEGSPDFNLPKEISLAKELWGNSNISEAERIPIWLDCDTGHDDAFAILISAHCPRLKLLGISTVHGNASLENTTKNTLSVLEAIGRRDTPVYPGAAKPFCRDAAHAETIHGETGLDGTTVLPIPVASPKTTTAGAIGAIHAALSACPPGKAWLITTGSLTNAALLFAVYPDLASHIAGLSIMGGAVGNCFTEAPMGRVTSRIKLIDNLHRKYPLGLPTDGTKEEIIQKVRDMNIIQDIHTHSDQEIWDFIVHSRDNFGNWSPVAEFNIFCDPESASAIFSSPILSPKTTLVTLDLTHKVLGTSSVLELINFGRSSSTSGNKGTSIVRQLFHEIISFFSSTYISQFAMNSGPPLHDPLAVVVALSPLLFDDNNGERFTVTVPREDEDDRNEDVNVRIERRGKGIGSQCGRTVLKMLDKGTGGVRVPRGVDVGVFWNLVEFALESAEQRVERK